MTDPFGASFPLSSVILRQLLHFPLPRLPSPLADRLFPSFLSLSPPCSFYFYLLVFTRTSSLHSCSCFWSLGQLSLILPLFLVIGSPTFSVFPPLLSVPVFLDALWCRFCPSTLKVRDYGYFSHSSGSFSRLVSRDQSLGLSVLLFGGEEPSCNITVVWFSGADGRGHAGIVLFRYVCEFLSLDCPPRGPLIFSWTGVQGKSWISASPSFFF